MNGVIFPKLVWHLIIEYLSYGDRCHLRATCRYLSGIANRQPISYWLARNDEIIKNLSARAVKKHKFKYLFKSAKIADFPNSVDDLFKIYCAIKAFKFNNMQLVDDFLKKINKKNQLFNKFLIYTNRFNELFEPHNCINLIAYYAFIYRKFDFLIRFMEQYKHFDFSIDYLKIVDGSIEVIKDTVVSVESYNEFNLIFKTIFKINNEERTLAILACLTYPSCLNFRMVIKTKNMRIIRAATALMDVNFIYYSIHKLVKKGKIELLKYILFSDLLKNEYNS